MYLRVFIGIDEVVGAYQRTVRDDLGSLVLLFTQEGSADGVDITVIIRPRSYLHKVERYLTEFELTAPLVHQYLHTLGVLVARVAYIRTALIVDDAFDGAVQDRIEGTVAPEQ